MILSLKTLRTLLNWYVDSLLLKEMKNMYLIILSDSRHLKYISAEIYTRDKLPHICIKLIFKRFRLKLATESTYIFQSQFYKQTDGCTKGGPLPVPVSNIYLTKLEKDQVKPLKPKFYRRLVDDVISRRLKNTHDSLFENLSN